MPNMLAYSNGWGHLVMSVAALVVAVVLLLQHDGTMDGIAIGIISSVQGYWFITSSANTVKAEMKQAVTDTLPTVTVTTPPQTNTTVSA